MNAAYALALCFACGADPKSAAETNDLWTIDSRLFKIPIRIDPKREKEIDCLVLWVSSDQGKSWKQAATASAKDDGFNFVAPDDGTYWFSLQIVYKNKSKEPRDVAKEPPGMKI